MAMSGVSNSVTSLSDREIFDKWCKCYGKTYKDKEEEKFRFSIFQKALNPPIPENERGLYFVGMADRTREELKGRHAYIFESDISLIYKCAEEFPLLEDPAREEVNPVRSLSNREIFDKWCKYYRITYNDDEEEEFRFNIFQKALNPPIPKKKLRVYFPDLADRTSEELDGVDAYVFESDIFKLMAGRDVGRFYGFAQSKKVFAELKDSVREEEDTDSNPKVENETKDFAPPIKKLKVDKDDLVGEEEHNTDSVTSLSDREIFDKWCKCFGKTYKDKEEEKFRFSIFQKALNPPIPENERGLYFVGMADRTREELKGRHAYIFESDISLIYKCAEEFPLLEDPAREEVNPVRSLSNREIFDKWCKYYRITYNDDEEEEFRFNIFQKALNPPIPKKKLRVYFPDLADRTSEELDGVDAYVFESDIFKLMAGRRTK